MPRRSEHVRCPLEKNSGGSISWKCGSRIGAMLDFLEKAPSPSPPRSLGPTCSGDPCELAAPATSELDRLSEMLGPRTAVPSPDCGAPPLRPSVSEDSGDERNEAQLEEHEESLEHASDADDVGAGFLFAAGCVK